MKKIIIFIFVIFCNFLFAQVFEIKNISEAKDLDKYQIVIFDIDNTILEPVQLLGCDKWFDYTLEKYVNEGLVLKEAFDKTLLEWYEIEAITKVKVVENEIKNLIDNLQNKKIIIFGLTTRGIELALACIKQLDSLGINLDKTSPYDKAIFFENGVVYKKGIIFADGKNKGETLKMFFNKIGFFPKSIAFIDDKLKNVLQVEDFCKSFQIKSVGYRYGFLDEKNKHFNSKICDIQHKNFKNILSDEEAIKLLNK